MFSNNCIDCHASTCLSMSYKLFCCKPRIIIVCFCKKKVTDNNQIKVSKVFDGDPFNSTLEKCPLKCAQCQKYWYLNVTFKVILQKSYVIINYNQRQVLLFDDDAVYNVIE